LERSLTVLLPVHDAANTLNSTVQELLDVLPELTPQFEVLIVDDGSAEMTTETAHELSRNFPQVRVVRQGNLSSREAAIRTGLARSTGEIVMLGEDSSGFRIDEIHRVWQSIKSQQAAATAVRSPALQRLPTSVTQSKGVRVIQKRGPAGRTSESLLHSENGSTPPKRPNYLRRLRDFALGE